MKRSMKTKILNTALSGLFLMLTGSAVPSGAAVPELINFQGKLADSGGKPITSAVPMVFKLYQGATGGSPVWTETRSVTPDIFGIYSVMLGEVTPFDISFSTAYWLGVAVGTDGEMLPRYRMVSSAYSLYSMNSATAAWAGGADWPAITNKPAVTAQGNTFNGASQLLQLGADGKLPAVDGSNLTGLPSAFLADASVTTAKLAANAVTDAKVLLSTAAVGSGKFGDDRVAVSTQALSGGVYNSAGKLVQMGPDGFLPALNGSNLTGLVKTQVGLGSVNNTSDAAKPVSVAQQTALDLKASLSGATFTGAVAATNLAGSNTGDETAATIKIALGAATASADGYLTSADWAAFNGKLAPAGNGSLLTGMTAGQVGLGSVDNTSDAAKPVSVAQQTALNLKANLSGATFTGAVAATNLAGSNTGDETAATIKSKLGAATASADGYLTSVNWAAFNGKLAPNGNGSALTSMTAAQVGLGSVNNTSDAAKPVSTLQQTALDLKASLSGATFTGAIAATNLSGTNTGDNAVNPLYCGLVTNATHTGDATGATALTVIGINGTSLAGLATGILKNTTGTGVPSIALAGDFPILNQNTTGNAATATNLTGLIASIANLNTVTGALGTAAFTESGAYATAAQGTLAASALPSASFTDAAVSGKLLTGYVSGAGIVSATDTIRQAIQKLNGNAAAASGDVYKASTQTFTGLNTFTSTITAKGFANMSQSVVLNSVTTFAAEGSGMVLMTFNGTGSIATITGCSSGKVGQGQIVTFVVSAWSVGGISFVDTIPAAAANDTMLLNGAAGTWTPPASAASLGAAITLLCTSVNTATPPATNMVKLWVEVGRSLSGA